MCLLHDDDAVHCFVGKRTIQQAIINYIPGVLTNHRQYIYFIYN